MGVCRSSGVKTATATILFPLEVIVDKGIHCVLTGANCEYVVYYRDVVGEP